MLAKNYSEIEMMAIQWLPRSLQAVILAMLSSSCSHYSEGHETKGGENMTAATVSNPNASAEPSKLVRKIVDLAISVSSPNEINGQALASLIGSPVEDLGNGRVGHSGRIGSDWTFALELSSNSSTRARLDLDFFDSTPSGSAETAAICEMSFDEASTELVGSGFSKAAIHGEHGRIISEVFAKPGIEVSIDTIGQSRASDTQNIRCIRAITIKANAI